MEEKKNPEEEEEEEEDKSGYFPAAEYSPESKAFPVSRLLEIRADGTYPTLNACDPKVWNGRHYRRLWGDKDPPEFKTNVLVYVEEELPDRLKFNHFAIDFLVLVFGISPDLFNHLPFDFLPRGSVIVTGRDEDGCPTGLSKQVTDIIQRGFGVQMGLDPSKYPCWHQMVEGFRKELQKALGPRADAEETSNSICDPALEYVNMRPPSPPLYGYRDSFEEEDDDEGEKERKEKEEKKEKRKRKTKAPMLGHGKRKKRKTGGH